jgi:hypothetical protein
VSRRAIAAAAAVLASSLAAGCAGGQHPWSGDRLCRLEKDAPGDPQDPVAWIELLLQGYDRRTGRATSPAVDCTGAQVRWETPALLCADPSTARVALPDRPLGPEDVIVSPLDEDRRLVWVITNRFASGDALGPAAVVQVRPRRLEVLAIGPLRANPVRARLAIERIGKAAVLVAQGEQCASADPASCTRGARLMPLVGDRFRPVSVTNDAGGCLSPAWFYLAREESERLPSGWRRRTRLDGNLVYSPAGVTVQEQVVVQDFDPRNPATPPRLFRRAESDLVVRMEEDRFRAEGASLWTRIMAAKE